MHKCHNYYAILHKLYMWFGKNELRLYLNGAKISSIGGAPPPSKYAHGCCACAVAGSTKLMEQSSN